MPHLIDSFLSSFSPLPSMRSGLMKLDYDMLTKITYNNGIGMRTSCMITMELSYDDDNPIFVTYL
jgi:hypothetical protein